MHINWFCSRKTSLFKIARDIVLEEANTTKEWHSESFSYSFSERNVFDSNDDSERRRRRRRQQQRLNSLQEILRAISMCRRCKSLLIGPRLTIWYLSLFALEYKLSQLLASIVDREYKVRSLRWRILMLNGKKIRW